MGKMKQDGFTLLEILVSVTILVVGLLGVLAMQLRSYTSIREAEKVSVVGGMTDALAEAMRSNAGLFAETTASETVIRSDWSHYETAVSSTTRPADGSPVSAGNLAGYHLGIFDQQLKEVLGAGTYAFSICKLDATQTLNFPRDNICNGTSGDDYVVRVFWETRDPSKVSSSDTTDPGYMAYRYQTVIDKPNN